MNKKDNKNCENFDDGLTKVAPKGQFKAQKDKSQDGELRTKAKEVYPTTDISGTGGHNVSQSNDSSTPDTSNRLLELKKELAEGLKGHCDNCDGNSLSNMCQNCRDETIIFQARIDERERMEKEVRDAIFKHMNCRKYHKLGIDECATCLDVVLKELNLSEEKA